MSAVQQGVILLVLTALCVGVASLPVQNGDGSGTAESKMKMHIIVMKKSAVNDTARSSMKCGEFLEMVSSGRYDGVDSSGRKPSVGSYHSVGIGYTAELDDMAVKMLSGMADVDFVEEDQDIEGAAFLYPIDLGYHTDRIDQRQLPLDGQYNPPFTGKGVDIYILDTGISYSHTLFEGRAQFGGFDNYGDDGKDCNGHGTHVAGLAGASTVGAATGANLYSIKVLDCQQSGTYAGLVAGMNHVISRAQNNPGRRSIISMSLIGPPSRSVDVALQHAHEAGVITVSAAGNFKTDSCDYSPASSEYTITVGGSRQNGDGLYWFENSGTNFGKCVDIFAPGQWVRSASHESDNHLVSMSGTSMSTPIVSGVVAMMLEEDPSLSPQEVKERLQERATKGALDFSVLTSKAQKESPNLLVYTGRREPTATPTTQATTTPTTPATTTPTTQATTTPTTQATTTPTTQATTTPTTRATTTPTTQATTTPTTQATTTPTTQATTAPPNSGPTPLPTVSSKLSPAVIHQNLKADIEEHTNQGLIPTNVNAYTVGDQLYFTVVYAYVGKENTPKYIFFHDLPVSEAEDTILALAYGFQPITLAPYSSDGQPMLFIVLERTSEERVLLLEKTKDEWSIEEAGLISQGYVPISFRYRPIAGGSSMIYSIFQKKDDVFFRWGLTYSQLLNHAYYERRNGNFVSDITWEQMENGTATYTAVFTKDRYGLTQFYVDARFNRHSFISTHSQLSRIGFHVKAVTPLIIGANMSPGFLGTYWR